MVCKPAGTLGGGGGSPLCWTHRILFRVFPRIDPRKFPTSRRIWRLYHSLLQKSAGWSLSQETSCYRRQIEALLLLQSRAADVAAMRASQQTGGGEEKAENGATGRGGGGGGGGDGSGSDGNGVDIVEMVVYLVLERCSVLAGAGYKLQAAAEALDALGALIEGQPLWGWDAADEQGRVTVLRCPSGVDDADGGRSKEVPNGASASSDGQGVAQVRI